MQPACRQAGNQNAKLWYLASRDDYYLNKMREIKGANMDIDFDSESEKIHWEQDQCPWNKKEKTKKHKCAVKNVSLCRYFKGIKYPDIVLCNFNE